MKLRNLTLAVFALALPCRAEGPNRIIIEGALEVIDTGYEIVSCCSTGPSVSVVGIWLSDNLFAFSAQRDVPDANEKQLEREILFDLNSRSPKVIIEEGAIQCWNAEKKVASITPHRRSNVRRLVSIDDRGGVNELSKRPDIDDVYCRPIGYEERLNGGMRSSGLHFKDSDGYIPYLLSGRKPDYHNDLAVWLRPGKPPLTLPILRKEIDGGTAQYLAYSGQYQLNHFNSYGSSNTDRRLAGLTWGNRRYDLTPYRLLSRDGRIEEIPYPYILREFGLPGFRQVVPTKVGLLVDNSGFGKGERGLFLLRGDRLVRFWGRQDPSGKTPTETVGGLILSPDGCKIAFRRFADWKPQTHKPVSIIDLCRGAQQ